MFVSTILSSTRSLQTACVTIESAVFEPKHLLDILTRHSLPHQYKKGTAVVAEGQRKAKNFFAQLSAILWIFSSCPLQNHL